MTRTPLLPALVAASVVACERAPCPDPLCGPATHTVTLEGRSDPEIPLTLITRVVLDPQYRAVVLDAGVAQPILIDANGGAATTVGGSGDGPGEFRAARSVRVLPGDTLFVYDGTHGRISYFSLSDGAFLDERTVSRDAGLPWSAEPLPSGAVLLLYQNQVHARPNPEDSPVDLIRILSPEGEVSEPIATVPSQELLIHRSNGGVEVTYHPFGRRSFMLPGPRNRFYLLRSDSLAITTRDARGATLSRWSQPITPVPPERATVEHWVERLGQSHGDVLRSDTMVAPVLDAPFVDNRGRIWIRATGEGVPPNRWLAIDPASGPRLAVDVPEGVQLTAVRDSQVVGLRTDAYDVPSLLYFRLRPRSAN